MIVLDDLGFGQLGCFGSDLSTPHIDALADRDVVVEAIVEDEAAKVALFKQLDAVVEADQRRRHGRGDAESHRPA